MRNTFSKTEGHNTEFDWENDYSLTDRASSPNQIAIVWNDDREVVAASPVSGNLRGSYDMDISRLPSDFNLFAALNMRRESSLDVPPLSEQTLFLTAVPNFAERTRILALSGDILALDDFELSEWLVEAEKQMFLGTDNHPVFETSLEDTACSITRLSNGQVAMTEVPRQYIETAHEKILSLIISEASTTTNFAVETPLRCVARYFLTALPEGSVALRPEKESDVTAFLIIRKTGFSYGLWSPGIGLFSEYAFLAPTEINQQESLWKEKITINSRKPVQNDETLSTIDPEENEHFGRGKPLEEYIRKAFDQLFLQLSPEKLEQLQLSGYTQVVWATEMGLSELVAGIAAEYSANTGLDSFQIGVPVDEAIAGGLLFGSFTFGDDTVAGAEILPPVNMARDLLMLADKEEIERRRFEEIVLQKRHSRAVFTLWAAPVVVIACLLALVADTLRTQAMLTFREYRADAKTQELKPALDRRNSYEANLKWYQEFIKQVSSLRRQQPVGIGMLYQLNQNYPFNVDPSFYVSDLKLLTNSGVEIKGLARNKDAVTSFLRSLEFAGGAESGKKLFSNLTYEVQEGVATANVPTNGQPNLPNITGSGLAGSNPAPGIIAWSIKGNYLPMAEFVPPDPAAKTVVNPATNPPVTTPTNVPTNIVPKATP